MKLEDRVQELENKVQELETQLEVKSNENKVMKEAVAFLLNKTKMKHIEAQPFKELFPEWSPDGIYPMNSYVTHGIDELGNKKLYFVNALVEKNNKRIPGNEPVSGFNYYSYSQDPNIGKDDE